MKWIQRISAMGIVICFISFTNLQAQSLSLDVEVNEGLAQSQSIDIQSLLANSGRGAMLFQLFMHSPAGEEDLYFNITFESDKIGLIARIQQRDNRPFSLDPGQHIRATNNSFANGLPGIEESIILETEFTQAGKEFFNNLKGSTSLPVDRYMVKVEINQGSSSGTTLASDMAEIGTNIVEDTRDFYLLSPGDEAASEAIINNTYPNFQWQGATGATYRLLVVESKNNESPQSLLDGSASTEPILENGAPGNGSLLDYEMLDVKINQSSFQYPNTGVQNLEPGAQYYWRVISELQTSGGVESRESEIWSFTLADQGENRVTGGSGEFTQALKKILGEQFQEFSQEGYTFQAVEIDGQIYRGGQALQKVMEIVRQAEDGDVSIVIEEQ